MGGRSHVHSLLWRAPPLFCAALSSRASGADRPPPLAPPSVLASRQPAAPPASPFYHSTTCVRRGRARRTCRSHLVNAWGWFPARRRRGDLRQTDGPLHAVQVSTGAIPLIVTVPGAGGEQSAPTGLVFNGAALCRDQQCRHEPARFIFASEDGTISGFRGVPVVIRRGQLGGAGRCTRASRTPATATGDFLYANQLSRRHRRRVRQPLQCGPT